MEPTAQPSTRRRGKDEHRQGVFPGNPSDHSPRTFLSTGCSFENTSTNKHGPQGDPSSGRGENRGRGKGWRVSRGRSGEGQVPGKRIMLHFLPSPDFQEVATTLKAALVEVNLDWLELRGWGRGKYFCLCPPVLPSAGCQSPRLLSSEGFSLFA